MSKKQAELTSDEMARYLQQLKLTEVGLEGQQKLKNARVLCVGAGGLGSSLLLYLAGAGVGTVGIIDDDCVESSNLQRQVIYQSGHVGNKKVLMAKQQIIALNPNINVHTYPQRLDLSHAKQIIEQYDIVADCSDNFSTRYLVNDVCFHLNIPYVFASISQFVGQCSLFLGHEGPCYRCLFPNHPDPNLVPTCAQGGVLGVLPGLFGIIQATEILKWILKVGQSLSGRLLIVDIMTMQFRDFNLQQNPECVLCVKNAPVEELNRPEICLTVSQPLLPKELKKLLEENNDIVLLDVRSLEEHASDNIGGILIPLFELANRYNELPKDKMIVIYCQSGQRSLHATKILVDKNFNSVKHLTGGLMLWRSENR